MIMDAGRAELSKGKMEEATNCQTFVFPVSYLLVIL